MEQLATAGGDGRRWMGRIMVAVILGEAIWALIVSVMNNVFVPWLGDIMGQSSGLPTSFTQRPYNYPELFVSLFEFCIAGLVAAILNYFFQRTATAKVRIVKSPVPAAPTGPIRVVPQTATTAAPPPVASPVAPAPVAKVDAVLPPAPAVAAPFIPAPVIAAAAPPPAVAPAPVTRPVPVVPPAPAAASPVAAKPQAPAAKVEPANPKKAKEVYYNIVGEPMPSDDD